MRLAGLEDTSALAGAPAPERETPGASGSDGFGAQLEQAIAQLDDSARTADATADRLVTGEVDIHEAMVAMEKADLVLRVAVSVRNKVIDAYQQLMQSGG